MSEVIKFVPKKVRMCPDDWATPHNPTYDELSQTLNTLKECYNDTTRQLATAGVQTEFTLKEKLYNLDNMRAMLMEYYKSD